MRLGDIRRGARSPFWKTILFGVMFSVLGAAAGTGSKFADVYSEILGGITSAMGVWVLVCTTVCVFSKSPFRAAAYVFLFCAAMIAGYYLTAEWGGLYYSRDYVRGWSVFTLFTPGFAFAAWFARGKGTAAWILRVGIAVVTLLGCFVFHGYLLIEVLFAFGAFALTLIKEKAPPYPRKEAGQQR